MRLLQYNSQSNLSINRKQVRLLVEEFFVLYQSAFSEVIVHFLSPTEISDLHNQLFNNPTPTDCITCPIREGDLLGEIFICPQMAIDYSPNNPYKEATLYIIHALLHLLGYDDIDPTERVKMRIAEEFVMNHLEKKKLILS